jgi:hypothetical protein
MDPPARSGYADRGYAESLGEWGTPRHLPCCDGSILVRSIPESALVDGMGPYPLFACRDWDALGADVAELDGELVSLTLVTDPFGAAAPAQLAEWFPDRCVAFKEHHVVDLSHPPLETASRHHRRDAARALRGAEVELVGEPPAFLDEWTALYEGLVRRHGVQGVARFSRRSFARQLELRDLVAFRARSGDTLLGGSLWIASERAAYYHLAATTDEGNRLGVSYALVAVALEHFAQGGWAWASLGAGAGLSDSEDGLTRFKRGWASGTRTAYLCGRVLDREAYAALGGGAEAYFPAYRAALTHR